MHAAMTTETAGSLAPQTLADGSRIRLRPLSERRDGADWVIGRPETGDFIAVPDVAHRVLALLRDGHAVDHVAARLRAETGKAFAVRSFVAALDDLGFVAAIDDDVRPDPVSPKPSLPWLRAAHVRWLLHPLTAAVAMAFAIVTVTALAVNHALIPSYRMLVWNEHPGIVIAINA